MTRRGQKHENPPVPPFSKGGLGGFSYKPLPILDSVSPYAAGFHLHFQQIAFQLDLLVIDHLMEQTVPA